jgi:hypothetical protein
MNIRAWRIMATAVLLAMSSVAFRIAAGAPGDVPFFAVLAGGNEVGPAGQASAGDPDGFGSATITIPNAGTLCFATLVTGIDTPVGAHVHRALPGRNGPIVVPLTPPVNGNPGTSSGCVANLDPALLAAIQQSPGAFYVNVHTVEFPAGALRGQLF